MIKFAIISLILVLLDLTFEVDVGLCSHAFAWGAIAAIGSQILGNVIQQNQANQAYNLSEEQADISRRFSRSMLDRQNAFTERFWNLTNDYNTPLKQRQRLQEAGYNPNLLASGNTGNATGISSSSALSAQTSDPSLLNSGAQWTNLGQSMVQAAQVENIKADTELKESQKEKTTEESKGLSIDNIYRALKHGTDLEEAGVRINLGKSEIDVNKETVEKIKKECENLAAQTAVSRKKVQEIESVIDLNYDKITSQMVERYVSYMQLQLNSAESREKIKLLRAQTGLTNEQCKNVIIKTAADAVGLPYQNEILRLNAKELACKEKYFDTLADNLVARDSALTFQTVSEANRKGRKDAFWTSNEHLGFIDLALDFTSDFFGSATGAFSGKVRY